MSYGKNKKYTMKERISYMQGRTGIDGLKGSYAKGYLKGVQDQRKAAEISKKRSEQKEVAAEKGGGENCGKK